MRTDFDTARSDPDAPAEDAAITTARTQRPGGYPEPDPDPVAEFDMGVLLAVPATDGRLDVAVVPARSDEFTCTRCHLICHRSRRVLLPGGAAVCRDCT